MSIKSGPCRRDLLYNASSNYKLYAVPKSFENKKYMLAIANIAYRDGDYLSALSYYRNLQQQYPSIAHTIEFNIKLCSDKLEKENEPHCLLRQPSPTKENVNVGLLSDSWEKDCINIRAQLVQRFDFLEKRMFSVVLDATRFASQKDIELTLDNLARQRYANIEVIIVSSSCMKKALCKYIESINGNLILKRGLRHCLTDLGPESSCNLLINDLMNFIRGDFVHFITPGISFDLDFYGYLSVIDGLNECPSARSYLIDAFLCRDNQDLPISCTFNHGVNPYLLDSSNGLELGTVLLDKEALIHELGKNRSDNLLFQLQNLEQIVVNCLRSTVTSTAPYALLRKNQSLLVPLNNGLKAGKTIAHSVRKRNTPISIIIPTKERLDLLKKCLKFIIDELESCNEVSHEIVIVDNGSSTTEILNYYSELGKKQGFKIVSSPGSFNFSHLVNKGVEYASNEILLLLNNDVEIEAYDNLKEALSVILLPSVGVVGTVLYYPDGSVQHAGMIASNSPAEFSHVLRGCSPPFDDLTNSYLKTPRTYQAVTGAFMLTKKSVYDLVDGFNEVDLPVDCNDVDYCFKVREMGLDVVCVPTGNTIHFESYTRRHQPDTLRARIQHDAITYMLARWPNKLACDVGRNPNICVEEVAYPQLRKPSIAQVTTLLGVTESKPGFHGEEKLIDISEVAQIMFDSAWYKLHYQDVANSGVDPLEHYLYHGYKEGRRIREHFPLELYKHFSSDFQAGSDNLLVDIQASLNNNKMTINNLVAIRDFKSLNPGSRSRLESGFSIYGYFFSEIGLGQAARVLGQAIDTTGAPAQFFNYRLLGRENVDEYKTKISHKSRCRYAIFLLPLQALIPPLTTKPLSLPGKYNILYGIWELPLPPEESRVLIESYDGIWVPSRYVQECFESIDCNAVVIPHPIPQVEDNDLLALSESVQNSAFTVFTYADLDSCMARKNPIGSIKAFKAAFEGMHDCQLVLKIRGAGSSMDRALIADAIRGIKNVVVIDQTLDRASMDVLMAQADCFLSLHRSEGFGFGCAEALALAKPVVATGYGGVVDFVTTNTAFPVEYRLVNVKDGEYLSSAQAVWADPDIDHAVHCLKQVYGDYVYSKGKALIGQSLIRREYSLSAVGDKIMQWASAHQG